MLKLLTGSKSLHLPPIYFSVIFLFTASVSFKVPNNQQDPSSKAGVGKIFVRTASFTSV